jgi:hypothetical protein
LNNNKKGHGSQCKAAKAAAAMTGRAGPVEKFKRGVSGSVRETDGPEEKKRKDAIRSTGFVDKVN